ncbi:hypothetical protein [Salinarimonas soli]|uniref:Uncharacterized protein n=1 Tax=Salinarimonas soli TaxID=1638099 RepID=A0A5B2VF45_9HYPH|nr:hypothetical protein [Salinarimonas soli]KAA2237564.1 hypothetical protein F0L46_11310 [Salinarimonas soli]
MSVLPRTDMGPSRDMNVGGQRSTDFLAQATTGTASAAQISSGWEAVRNAGRALQGFNSNALTATDLENARRALVSTMGSGLPKELQANQEEFLKQIDRRLGAQQAQAAQQAEARNQKGAQLVRDLRDSLRGFNGGTVSADELRAVRKEANDFLAENQGRINQSTQANLRSFLDQSKNRLDNAGRVNQQQQEARQLNASLTTHVDTLRNALKAYNDNPNAETRRALNNASYEANAFAGRIRNDQVDQLSGAALENLSSYRAQAAQKLDASSPNRVQANQQQQAARQLNASLTTHVETLRNALKTYNDNPNPETRRALNNASYEANAFAGRIRNDQVDQLSGAALENLSSYRAQAAQKLEASSPNRAGAAQATTQTPQQQEARQLNASLTTHVDTLRNALKAYNDNPNAETRRALNNASYEANAFAGRIRNDQVEQLSGAALENLSSYRAQAKQKLDASSPNRANAATQTSAAETTQRPSRYGTPEVIQTFQSNRWRGREIAVYQVQNRESGAWEVRAQSLQPNRIERDVLVFSSNRRVRDEDFGREGQILPKLSEAAQKLNAPSNIRQGQTAGTPNGNLRDAAVGVATGIPFDLPKMVVGIPEGLFRNAVGLSRNIADGLDRLVDVADPADRSRTGPSNPLNFERRTQFTEANNSQAAVQNLQNNIARNLGANPDSRAFQLGDLLGGFLAPSPGGRAGTGAADNAASLATRRNLGAKLEGANFAEIKAGLDRIGPEGMNRLAREYPQEAGQIAQRLRAFDNPEAQRLAEQLKPRAETASAGRTNTSSAITRPAVPPAATRATGLNDQLGAALDAYRANPGPATRAAVNDASAEVGTLMRQNGGRPPAGLDGTTARELTQRQGEATRLLDATRPQPQRAQTPAAETAAPVRPTPPPAVSRAAGLNDQLGAALDAYKANPGPATRAALNDASAEVGTLMRQNGGRPPAGLDGTTARALTQRQGEATRVLDATRPQTTRPAQAARTETTGQTTQAAAPARVAVPPAVARATTLNDQLGGALDAYKANPGPATRAALNDASAEVGSLMRQNGGRPPAGLDGTTARELTRRQGEATRVLDATRPQPQARTEAPPQGGGRVTSSTQPPRSGNETTVSTNAPANTGRAETPPADPGSGGINNNPPRRPTATGAPPPPDGPNGPELRTMSGRRVEASAEQRAVLNDNPTLQIVEQRGDGSIYAQKPEGGATNVYRIASDGKVSPVGGAQAQPITPVELNRMVPTTDDASTIPPRTAGTTPGGALIAPGGTASSEVAQTPPRAIDRLNDVERPPMSAKVRELRLNLEDFNNGLEARRDAYEPGQGRIPAFDRVTEQLNLDTNYIRAQRQDASENRPNLLQQGWQNTESLRQNVIDGVHAYRDAVPNALGRVTEPFVNRVARPLIRSGLEAAENVARPVLGFAKDTVVQPLTNAVGNTVGRAADDFFHNNPIGNDVRLTTRELFLGNPDPLNQELPRNSLRNEVGRTVYEGVRMPIVQRTSEAAQSAIDLAGAAFNNVATRAEPIVAPIQGMVTGTLDNLRTVGQVAATQVLPGAIGWASFTGDIRPLSQKDAKVMLQSANFSTNELQSINPGALGIRTSETFLVDARIGFIYSGPTIKGVSPQAIARGDFGNAIQWDQLVASQFVREGADGAQQAARNVTFRASGALAGAGYSVSLKDYNEIFQVRGNAVVQFATFGGGARLEGGAITSGEGFQLGTRGYGALGIVRYSGDLINIDLAPTNIPGMPSRFSFGATRPRLDPTLFPNDGLRQGVTPAEGLVPGVNAPPSVTHAIFGGGHNPLIDHQATLSLAPNIKLEGVSKLRLDNGTELDGSYAGTALTQRGGVLRLANIFDSPLANYRQDSSTYDMTMGNNPTRLAGAEQVRERGLDSVLLPGGTPLFVSPEQIRLDTAQNGLRGLQSRLLANPADPDVRKSLAKLMGDLTTKQPPATQEMAKRELELLLNRSAGNPAVLRNGDAVRDLFEKYSGVNSNQAAPAPRPAPAAQPAPTPAAPQPSPTAVGPIQPGVAARATGLNDALGSALDAYKANPNATTRRAVNDAAAEVGTLLRQNGGQPPVGLDAGTARELTQRQGEATRILDATRQTPPNQAP